MAGGNSTTHEDTTPDLEAIRSTASRLFVMLLWLYTVIITGIAYVSGNSVLFCLVSTALAAGLATLMWMQGATVPMTRFTISGAMASQWMILIYAASNTPGGFILEAHMMYFVMTCQLIAYFCWRSIVVVSVIPAVHHLTLTFFYPLFVWPDLGFNLLHLANHVVLVVLTATPALWLAWRVNGLFLASHAALEEARRAGDEKTSLEAENERRSEQANLEKTRAMQQLADGFEASVRRLVTGVLTTIDCLKVNGSTLSQSAEHTQRQSDQMAGAAEQASHSVESVASATEQLTASINEISQRVTESARIAQTAVEEATRTNVTVASLSAAAQKIGEVVGLINNIASQTNLLALNATIEAARAGEAGKGFAVVASEVKNLANQTGKATEDIQAQVAQMQSVTGTAVDAIKSITGTIGHMSEIATTIASAVEQQGSATREITRNVHDASGCTREVTRTISVVAQAAIDTRHAADETIKNTQELSKLSSDLRREVDGFVVRIRKT